MKVFIIIVQYFSNQIWSFNFYANSSKLRNFTQFTFFLIYNFQAAKKGTIYFINFSYCSATASTFATPIIRTLVLSNFADRAANA